MASFNKYLWKVETKDKNLTVTPRKFYVYYIIVSILCKHLYSKITRA